MLTYPIFIMSHGLILLSQFSDSKAIVRYVAKSSELSATISELLRLKVSLIIFITIIVIVVVLYFDEVLSQQINNDKMLRCYTYCRK